MIRAKFFGQGIASPGRSVFSGKISYQGEGNEKRSFSVMVLNHGDNDVTLTPQYSADNSSFSNCAVGAQTIKAQASKTFEFFVPGANDYFRFLAVGNSWLEMGFMDNPPVQADIAECNA